MSEQTAPMVRLDTATAGQAPALSYNVPDPTSYPGRSYITLLFEKDPFPRDVLVILDGTAVRPVSNRLAGTAAQTPGTLSPGSRAEGFARSVRAEAAGREIVAPLAPEAGVAGFAPSNSVPAGLLASGLVEGGSPTVERADQKQRDAEEAAHTSKTPVATVQVIEPREGTEVTAGPDGVTLPVRIKVTTQVRPGVLPPGTVSVKIGDTTVEATAQPGAQRAKAEYVAIARVTAGPISVTASAEVAGKAWHSPVRSVLVKSTPASSAPPDLKPPAVNIATPESGTALVLQADGHLTIRASGTARDEGGSGLKDLQIRFDAEDWVTVEPDAAGQWSLDLDVTEPGDHVVLAKAVDAVDLQTTVAASFSVEQRFLARHRLMLVEVLRLSNFLGRYGAGRVVQTFSLLPGEKTRITIRSYSSTAETRTETASIFDSFSDTVTDELTDSIGREDTSRSQEESDLKLHANVKAGASWGWGSASVEAGVSSSTASAREQLCKNVMAGTSRHAAEKSSKRDVKVDTTTTDTKTAGTEETIERSLENPNLSRTLNFVFRQMTQEFISLLHLVDVRVAHLVELFNVDGTRAYWTDPADKTLKPRVRYEEISLPQLDDFLARTCVSDEAARHVTSTILRQLDAVFDYRGERKEIIEAAEQRVPVRDPETGDIKTEIDPATGEPRVVTEVVRWLRFSPKLTTTYPHSTDPSAGFSVTVPGVVLAAGRNTLRTDGVIVDAFLGGGIALDGYATELQRSAISVKEAEAALATQRAEAVELANKLVEDGNGAAADIFAKVFPALNENEDHE
jgi:hypothetical protein